MPNAQDTSRRVSSPRKGRWPLYRYKLKEDYRARLPSWITRFLGYRIDDEGPPYDPLPFPPFIWLNRISLRLETMIFAWIGAFGGILLIEAIMSTSTAFRDVYSAPIIITSFGASAVLVFGVVESPVAQPRNFVLGHFVSALVGVCITRLFVLNPRYIDYLDNTEFHGTTFVNGGLSMATSLLGQLCIGAVHPPAGATGLNAAVLPGIFFIMALSPYSACIIVDHARLGDNHQQPWAAAVSGLLVAPRL